MASGADGGRIGSWTGSGAAHDRDYPIAAAAHVTEVLRVVAPPRIIRG
jgi:hypothetical protein